MVAILKNGHRIEFLSDLALFQDSSPQRVLLPNSMFLYQSSFISFISNSGHLENGRRIEFLRDLAFFQSNVPQRVYPTKSMLLC